MTRKNILKMVSATVIFVVIFAILTAVLEPKWNYYGNQTQTRVQAFYRQEKNSHNIIYLGSSFSYCGISPLKIWEEQGITGYVFSNPDQKAWMSAYYLEEALKYQNPEVVVYECGAILEEKDTDEGHNRKNIDYLRWSPTKLKAILDICKSTGESKKEYLLPLLRFHSRWSDLDQTDFHLAWDSSYYLMGTALKMTTRPASDKAVKKYESWQAGQAEDIPDKIGPRAEAAVNKMKKMCDEKGITFQLVRMPSMQWSPEAHDIVQTYADSQGIPFLDMNLHQEEIQVNWKTDTHDKGNHLNIRGCEKASSFLGNYLTETYEFDTERWDANKEYWNASAKKFQSLLDSYELPLIKDCSEYAQSVKKEDFITMVTVCGTTGDYFTKEQRSSFEKLGLHIPEESGENGGAYLAILDGTEVIEEQSGSGVKKSAGYALGEDVFQVVSADLSDAAKTDVRVNDESFEVNQPGIHIVVYDKTVKNVVDVVNFDTTKADIPVKHIKQTILEDDGGE